MAEPATVRLLSLVDAHRAPLAEFDYYPDDDVLCVRWHGHLTAAEVIRVGEAGLALRRQGSGARRLLNDKSGTTGDWGEALPWLQYEWLPQAVDNGLCAMAYTFSSDLDSQLVSQEFVEAVHAHINIKVFHSPVLAWEWLVQQNPRGRTGPC